ncbi:hypothetical protein PZH42_31530, partial [Bacteroides cellulosilyticus]
DMDMESRAYHKHLKELVEEGVVDIKYVDEAVKRILLKKSITVSAGENQTEVVIEWAKTSWEITPVEDTP